MHCRLRVKHRAEIARANKTEKCVIMQMSKLSARGKEGKAGLGHGDSAGKKMFL